MYDPDFSSPNPTKLKRNGLLGLTAKQQKYLTPKQKGYYLEKRGLDIPSTDKISTRIKKARKAALVS